MQIGKKISERRKAQGLTQEHLASEMGVSIAAVSKWETGNSLPDIMMLCSLADFFGITTDELLGRTNHRRKVIIADDSDFLRKTVRSLLEENGMDVVAEAENGSEMMRLLKTKKTDIVLLDMMMPVMDGMEALTHIRAEYPGIKVIMCSAANNQATVDQALELGTCGYVVKPFMPEGLLGCISRV